MRDGRYGGANDELTIDLRVDEAVAGVISADLFRNGPGDPEYVASLRTSPGMRIKAADEEWLIFAQDELGAQATGRLSLTPLDDDASDLLGSIVLDGRLNGLASRRKMTFTASWDFELMRRVVVEIDEEEGVAPIGPYRFERRDITLESCFAEAGISVGVDRREGAVIPAPDGGWGTTQLHALLADVTREWRTGRAWRLHLLLLSRSTRGGLLGEMFDEAPPLPRQGAAVFADVIRELKGPDADRSLIQTAVHELGHALNLAHRFERGVGRADSFSFMNYDWLYGGGSKEDEFWSRFACTFDSDEVEYLRHAPFPSIVPGGAPFKSIDYWVQAGGGYASYLPAETTMTGVTLELRGPGGSEKTALFRFGQPIFLEVIFTNETGQPLDVHPSVLDVKTGLLDILVRRVRTGTSGDLAEARPFVPILQRCFVAAASEPRRLAHGEPLSDNVQLAFGAGGFALAEPGMYDVTAVVAVPDVDNQRELIARSAPLRIRVGHPEGLEEERDGIVLLDPEVGTYFALGGTDALPEVKERLAEIRDRRRGDLRDPVVAAIVRAEGIDAGRTYVRLEKGELRTKRGDPDRSAELLTSLDDEALRAFDRSTAEETRKLAIERSAG